MNKTKEKLQDLIWHAQFKLKQYNEEKLESENARKVYYRTLIEKAKYKKELELLDQNEAVEFIKKTVRKIRNKKLICDSF